MFIPIFVVWFFAYGRLCPRNNTNPLCTRREFYGFSYSHFACFLALGFLYPKDMAKWLLLGFLFEIFEYWLTKNPWAVERVGGYLSVGSHGESPGWFKRVGATEKKHENFIDECIGLEESPTDHTWHFSVGENLTNVIAFLIGRHLRAHYLLQAKPF